MSSDPLTIQTSTAPPPPPAQTTNNQPQTPTADPPTSRPSSPVRPPISPITPRATFAELARYTANQRSRGSAPPPPAAPPPPSFSHPPAFSSATPASAPPLAPAARPPPLPPATEYIAQPAPVPIAEDDNIDALALKAAISILQVQRERSRQDVRTWETLRKEAGRDPKGFWEALQAGRLRRKRVAGDAGFLGPTLAGMEGDDGGEGGRDGGEGGRGGGEEDEDDDEDAEDEDETGEGGNGAGEAGKKGDDEGRFPKLPEMQNIFRCPPVNWAKYHVVGESLDKLHEEQMKRPNEGEPTFDPGVAQGSGSIVKGQVDHLGRAPESVVAKPYSMFDDGNLKGSGKGG